MKKCVLAVVVVVLSGCTPKAEGVPMAGSEWIVYDPAKPTVVAMEAFGKGDRSHRRVRFVKTGTRVRWLDGEHLISGLEYDRVLVLEGPDADVLLYVAPSDIRPAVR